MAFFLELPAEVLGLILKYCSVIDLCRLAQTCQRFHYIVLAELTRQVRTNRQIPLVTNQLKTNIKERSAILMPPFHKLRVSHNWKIGKYKEHILLEQRVRFMPWIHLDRHFLWFSRGNKLRRYNRNSHGIIWNRPDFTISDNTDEIIRFCIKYDRILLGLRDGAVMLSNNLNSSKCLRTNVQNGEITDVNAIDLCTTTFATGTRSGVVKIWPWPERTNKSQTLEPLIEMRFADRIWSVAYNQSGLLAIGTSGKTEPPLCIADLETKETVLNLKSRNRPGDGILDMHWQNQHCFLTCGYESTVRLWDLRVGSSVCYWDEPHNSTLYCLQSDDLYTLMCGTRNHGKVTLWDQRQRNFVQMYFLSSYRNESTPVFSVAFDATVLYGALDRSVNILNFWSTNNRIRNYSCI